MSYLLVSYDGSSVQFSEQACRDYFGSFGGGDTTGGSVSAGWWGDGLRTFCKSGGFHGFGIGGEDTGGAPRRPVRLDSGVDGFSARGEWMELRPAKRGGGFDCSAPRSCSDGSESTGEPGLGFTGGSESVHREAGSGGGVGSVQRGKNYDRNKKKREQARRARLAKPWRFGGVSSDESVCTVDTRTAAQMEATDTLAKRRAAENRVAEAKARHQLRSLLDKDKTDAVKRLDAARMEQRINEAKSKSQKAYATCDNSLKSLGSTGSAGEFALKQTATKYAAVKSELEFTQMQMAMTLPHCPPSVHEKLAAMGEPVKVGIRDVMDEPDDSWTQEEIEAYWDIVNAENQGNYDTDWASYFPKPGVTKQSMSEDAARYAHG